jgi:hypothetical protein
MVDGASFFRHFEDDFEEDVPLRVYGHLSIPRRRHVFFKVVTEIPRERVTS